MMESADFEEVWYIKRVFIENVCDKEIFFVVIGEEVNC